MAVWNAFFFHLFCHLLLGAVAKMEKNEVCSIRKIRTAIEQTQNEKIKNFAHVRKCCYKSSVLRVPQRNVKRSKARDKNYKATTQLFHFRHNTLRLYGQYRATVCVWNTTSVCVLCRAHCVYTVHKSKWRNRCVCLCMCNGIARIDCEWGELVKRSGS